MTDEVIEFKPGAEVTPVQSKKFCSHSHVLAIEHTRMLECQHCGAAVEPFDFIWEWANKRLRFRYSLIHYREELKEAGIRMEELKRQERNIKSRIQRAQRKLHGPE